MDWRSHPKVDYDKLAATYDQHRRGGGPYLRLLTELAARSGARRVIEVGAGTGNNTQAFAAAYPCRLVALELSSGMLARALAKGIDAVWVRGTALELPFADETADFVFGVYVLHHIGRLDRLLRECYRVLRAGAVAFVTAPLDFIDRHPMNRYFPSFARIDRARFPAIEDILVAFEQAGFQEAGQQRFLDAPKPIGPEFVQSVASKFVSTYDLIPQDEYEVGLERLRADVAARGVLDETLEWESSVVWALKPAR